MQDWYSVSNLLLDINVRGVVDKPEEHNAFGKLREDCH